MAGPPLVTGGTGFAGRHLLTHLLERHPRVSAWAHRGGRPVDATDDRIAWSQVDLLDAAAVATALEALSPSAVYHCAGIAHVGDAWADPALALAVNAQGTQHVFDGVERAGLRCPVLVTGSAMVYQPSADALDEDAPLVPGNPYGISKLAQEMVARRAATTPAFVVRPFNHAGPGQSAAYVTSSFARQIAEIEAGRMVPVLRVGNLDARRDITDVRDTVRAYPLVIERGQPGRPYNVCSGRAHRVGDLLEILLGHSTRRITVERDESRLRPSDNPVVLGDPGRIRSETGWQAEIPIERTLGDLLDNWRRIAGGSLPATS